MPPFIYLKQLLTNFFTTHINDLFYWLLIDIYFFYLLLKDETFLLHVAFYLNCVIIFFKENYQLDYIFIFSSTYLTIVYHLHYSTTTIEYTLSLFF